MLRLALGVLLVASVLVPGLAVAQASQNGSASPGPATNETAQIEVSPQLTVLDYNYAGGSMTVTVRAEYSQLVAVSDLFGAIPENGGASRMESRRVRVPGGVSELQVDASPYRGLAVVTVSSGGNAVTLAERVDDPLIGPPWSSDDAQAAGIGALFGSLFLTAAIGWRKVSGVGSDIRRLI